MSTSLKELRSMTLKDLSKEISQQRDQVKKLEITVRMQKEKNTAKYKNAKKHLAQMSTVLTEKRKEELQSSTAASKVSAPSAS